MTGGIVDASVQTGGVTSTGGAMATGGAMETGGEADGSIAEPNTIAASALSLGYYHACAIKLDGTAVCWGREPVVPPDGVVLQRIYARGGFTCGQLATGRMACWGDDAAGETTPPDVDFVQASVGTRGGCLVDTAGLLQCWGRIAEPLPSPLPEFISIHLNHADRYGACGLTADGALTCWGQLEEPPSGSFETVSVGSRYACALDSGGSLSCFGADGLGMGSPPPSTTFKSVSTHRRFSCGIDSADEIRCWGAPSFDLLSPPTGAFVEVQVGEDFACAIRKEDQRVVCWGNDSMGQLEVPTEES